MQILSPQSALLTTTEVHQFLLTNPLPSIPTTSQFLPSSQITSSKPSSTTKPTSAYPPISMRNATIIRDDFLRYCSDTIPFVTQRKDVEEWIGGLLKELKPWTLTKGEVVGLLDLGVGSASSVTQTGNEVKMEIENGETEAEDEEVRKGRWVSLFRLVVEDVDERFDEEGIERIIEILGEGIKTKGRGS